MLPSNLLADAEWLLRAICPRELAGWNIYVVDQADLVRNFTTRALASTHEALDLLLESELRHHGVWQGRGFCVVFRTPLAMNFHGLLLHEFGHWMASRGWRQERDPVKALEQPTPRARTDRETHGLDFIRACLHLHWRAASVGCNVRFQTLHIDGRQGLGDLFGYQEALSAGWPGELAEAEIQGLSIGQVLDTPPPEAFLRHYIQDTLQKAS